MMFDRYTLEKILSVTRRVRRSNKPPARVGKIHKLKIDRTKATYGYIRILSVYEDVLGNLTESDALKEGFGSVDEYFAYFKRVNKMSDFNTPIWVVEFELLD